MTSFAPNPRSDQPADDELDDEHRQTSVSGVVRAFATRAGWTLPRGVAMSVRCCDAPAFVAVPRAALVGVVLELCGSAMRGMASGGVVSLDVTVEPSGAGWPSFVRVDVHGRGGPAAPPTAARALIGAHGGTIALHTRGDQWRAVLRLPIVR